MTYPVLVCQAFQRAFIDVDSPAFSVSASVRRGVCEQVLKRARILGWTIVHAFLEFAPHAGAGAASIDGFSPAPAEPYVRQRTLSAFDSPGFRSRLEAWTDSPIFLISFAGLSPIAATFLDGLALHLPIYIVGDAVADAAHAGVSEQELLTAICTLARAHGRHITCREVLSMHAGEPPAAPALALGRSA